MLPGGIILDTNVWRYINDAQLENKLLVASHRSGVRILAAPSVLYEALNTDSPDLRKSLVRIITNSRWHRLLPEAFQECEEILYEIKRIRPEWLLPNPDLIWRERNLYDWKRLRKGLWERARKETAEIAKVARFPYLDEAREQARLRRNSIATVNPKEWKNSPWVQIPEGTSNSGSERIKLWRFEGCNVVRKHLSIPTSPYRDWLLPFLNLPKISKTSWSNFWFYEVDEEAMPRHQLRTLCEWQQGFHKVSPGTPGDSQLAAYLTDAQYICSADKIFIQIVEDISAQISFSIAKPIRISGGSAGMQQLLQWFASPDK